jgi:SAM-dependent methyltransferase
VSEDLDAVRMRLLDGWDEASGGWGRQADRMRDHALPISMRMLELAELQPGERVLELAAGPGDTGFLAAEQIGPGGTLVCSDASEPMLAVARERAAEQGISNVEFLQLQLEWIDLPTASVDAILCRWAVMLCVDPGAALSECRRVLRPGGRAVIAVWDLPETNPWNTIPMTVLAEHGFIDPQDSVGPGMYQLSAPGVLAEGMGDAGFLEVFVEPVAIHRHYDSSLDLVGETLDCSMRFGRAWSGLTDAQRRVVRAAIHERCEPFSDAGGHLVIPGSSLVALGCS